MSDTSGRVRYEPTKKKKIKERVEQVKLTLGGGASARKGSLKKTLPIADLATNLPKELVWAPLHADGLLTKAYNESEIVAYLKLMAEFIETAADSGLEEVAEKFNVESNSSFSLLQRRIRERVAKQDSSEFNDVARRAFQVGSTTWAGRLLKQTDPTKFKLARVVENVRQQVERALLLAPNLILQDYGERLLISALPGGEGNRNVVEATIKAFRSQFDSFMKENNDPAAWGSGAIAATVKKYEKLLWR